MAGKWEDLLTELREPDTNSMDRHLHYHTLVCRQRRGRLDSLGRRNTTVVGLLLLSFLSAKTQWGGS